MLCIIADNVYRFLLRTYAQLVRMEAIVLSDLELICFTCIQIDGSTFAVAIHDVIVELIPDHHTEADTTLILRQIEMVATGNRGGIPIHDTMGSMLVRNLVYTAVTRTKKKCILIGSQTALIRALSYSVDGHRSMLATRRQGMKQ